MIVRVGPLLALLCVAGCGSSSDSVVQDAGSKAPLSSPAMSGLQQKFKTMPPTKKVRKGGDE